MGTKKTETSPELDKAAMVEPKFLDPPMTEAENAAMYQDAAPKPKGRLKYGIHRKDR